jgi:hypothetical protein
MVGQALACGTSYNGVPHSLGNGAPVGGTFTYGTVSNVAGEPSKCWITRNLGAEQQATAVNDATTASAGWYWQFNRKQGYSYNTVLTPSSWNTEEDEDYSEWQQKRDPCYNLLGPAWRLPTSSEWANVRSAGNWTTWTGPFNSALKMHAAGSLSATNGVIQNRGTRGEYWSSNYDDFYGTWSIVFGSTFCNVSSYGGFINAKTVRCIRD